MQRARFAFILAIDFVFHFISFHLISFSSSATSCGFSFCISTLFLAFNFNSVSFDCLILFAVAVAMALSKQN